MSAPRAKWSEFVHYGPVYRRADGTRPEPGATLSLCEHGKVDSLHRTLTTHEPTVTCPACLKALEAGKSGWPRR